MPDERNRNQGRVANSIAVNSAKASPREPPHMSAAGRRLAQKPGRSARPNTRQRMFSSSCTHATPAGLPCGMPGNGEVIDGATQQAPQPSRQSRQSRMAPV